MKFIRINKNVWLQWNALFNNLSTILLVTYSEHCLTATLIIPQKSEFPSFVMATTLYSDTETLSHS